MLANILYTLLLLEITYEMKISTWALLSVCLNNLFLQITDQQTSDLLGTSYITTCLFCMDRG